MKKIHSSGKRHTWTPASGGTRTTCSPAQNKRQNAELQKAGDYKNGLFGNSGTKNYKNQY